MPKQSQCPTHSDFVAILPKRFLDWFAQKGWQPRPHQLDLAGKVAEGQSMLLIAPTGAGKTLAGFLPSLIDLEQRNRKRGKTKTGIHTLYISPLKALAVDIERNLTKPVAEMGLNIAIETRSGDTPQHKRQRQKLSPPDILLTTPEQLSLLLANRGADKFFEDLKLVIFDELHSLVTSKRGHMLALDLAHLRSKRPQIRTIGLSATVANPNQLQQWLVGQDPLGEVNEAGCIEIGGGAKPNISILSSQHYIPWAGHSAHYAMENVYAAIKQHQTSLLFVNTRSQAELLFKELWHHNKDNLPIALHHGSLDVSQRRKVEAAMQSNSLRAIVATSTLDMGIDWGDVDLVIHVGAPKGASRLAQRIGRSNHRMDEPSKAILVPANRFEILECQAALDGNYLGHQDSPPVEDGSLDVLAQHILAVACGAPFDQEKLFNQIRSASPYATLTKDVFERTLEFVATGGYALNNYEQYAKIRERKDGLWSITHPRVAQQYRLNAGTIIEAPMLQVRLTRGQKRGGQLRGGPVLGKIEEGFLESLTPGDTFLFSGKVLAFEGIRENICYVSKTEDNRAKIPAYQGGKFPLSTYLAAQVRQTLANPDMWAKLPPQVNEWLDLQRQFSKLPGQNELLVETFPRASNYYMVCYPFEGRLAHQTLGMLLTRRLERINARPLGFVATDYAVAIWGLRDMGRMSRMGELALNDLFEEDMLGDDLETWLAQSYLLKRTFRQCATIAGLIEKRHPGKEKSGRQMTVSSDLIYDVLREHEPDHILLQATRSDAARGLLDIRRLGDMLKRIKNRICHIDLERISPLAVPIMLEIGKEPIHGEAQEALLAEAAGEFEGNLIHDPTLHP